MDESADKARQAGVRSLAERGVERLLFDARWMMVPFYLGLLFTLVLLFGVFVRELLKYLPDMWTMDANTAILATLTLIDLALVGNLVVIVVLASYETMVSRIDTDAERPGWMGSLGFADVKQKLFTSIVAISGIHLLKLFMSVGGNNSPDERTIFWLTVVHVVFVVTTLLSAGAEWVGVHAKRASADLKK